MKKLLATICAAALLMTGCGGDSGNDKPAEEKPAEIKLGMLTYLNATEQKLAEIYNAVADKAGFKGARHNPKFYDNLNSMQMAIEAGEVQEVSLYKSVADYVIVNNDKFEIVKDDALDKLKNSFCFAVRKDDTQLKADLDKAIGEMKADGTLDKLINDYITNVDKGQAPPKVDIPKIDGAPTLKVGITGDLPPLDLILPDNSPAGFNTALLAEIAKRLGRNIEPVQIESGARATALTSKFIDVVFWAVIPLGNDIPADIDKPEGLELSTPYFQDSIAHLKLKADK